MKKRLVIFISALIILSVLYLVVFFTPKNYTTTYDVDNYKIEESFDKKRKLYTFKITQEDGNIEYSFTGKYHAQRRYVTSIEKENDCYTVNLKKLDSFNICQNSDGYYTSYASNTFNDLKPKDTYEKINIYDMKENSYLIWNYTDFIGLNATQKEKIKLFQDDLYKLDIAYEYNNMLVLPDYDSKYTFNKLYIINPKKMKYDTLKLDRDIYFNSYVLGDYKKHLYLYDLQAEEEYVIDMKKGIVEKNNYEILIDGSWEEVSKNKLNKKNLFFAYERLFKYELDDNTLYYVTPTGKIKVTDMEVSSIIKESDKDAYFISKDSLYHVNIDEGITLLLSSSEWEFNNRNIYIFNNN